MACETRHRIRFHLFLQWGAQLECKEDIGNTPLLICSKNGCQDLVKLLLQRGAEVNACNDAGDTPLILSIRSPGHLEITKLLLADQKIDVDRQNKAGYTALHTAIQELDLEAIRLLLLANAKCDEDETFDREGQDKCINQVSDTSFNHDEDFNENAFMLAKRLGISNLLQILNTVIRPTPLLKACLNRNVEYVKLMLDSQFSQVKSPHRGDNKIIADFLRSMQKEGSRVGDVEIQIVQELIDHGASVNARETYYELPIASAVMFGNYQLVEIFCQHGADLSLGNCYSSVMSAVEIASANGQCDILKLLIHFKAQLSNMETYCWPLRSALKNGHIQCAQLLLEHGAPLHLHIKESVFDAIDTQQLDILIFLYQVMPIEVTETVCKYSKDVISLFNCAVEKGQLDVINFLLEIGADVNQKEYDSSPLANTTDPGILLTLIQKGAKVNIAFGPKNSSPLTSLSQKKTAHFALKILLDAGANVNNTDSERYSALHFAAKLGCIDNVKILMEYGADINIASTSGWTPLMEAMKQNAVNTALYLIQRGANVNAQNNDGDTPLMLALKQKAVDTALYLIQRGANANAQNNDGDTPLMLAVKHLSESSDSIVFDQLIQAGANLELRNKGGFTSFLMAAETCSAHLELLIAAGADVSVKLSKGRFGANALELVLMRGKNVESWDCENANALLDLGFDAKEINPIVMHKLILSGHIELVKRLMEAGLNPSDEEICEKRSTTGTLYSPLSIALRTDRLKLARFFRDNGYLTETDLSITDCLPDDDDIDMFDAMQMLSYSYQCINFLEELKREIPSLQVLSFLSISFAVGFGPQREERVNQLPLPQGFKDKLLFKKTEAVEGMFEVAKFSEPGGIDSWGGHHYFARLDYYDSDDDYY